MIQNYFGMPTELYQLGFSVECIPLLDKHLQRGKMMVDKENKRVYLNYKDWYKVVYFSTDFDKATDICIKYASEIVRRHINDYAFKLPLAKQAVKDFLDTDLRVQLYDEDLLNELKNFK